MPRQFHGYKSSAISLIVPGATRFKPGQSGNPAGKPRGLRNKVTLAVEALLDGEAEKLTRKAVELCLKGDLTALHQMRVALTHLRTAILFFSPMVEDAIRDEIRDELKWLNGELGAVRDLDVAVERVVSLDKKRQEVFDWVMT